MEQQLHDADTFPDGSGRSVIADLLHAFGARMHLVGARFAAREDLHPTDLQALSHLARADAPMTAGELADAMELSSGATTRLVDRLERMGHVARREDEDDRRRRRIAVSPSARVTAGDYFGELGRRIEALLAPMSADERTIVARFLTDLVAAMDVPLDEEDVEGPTTA